VALSTVLGSLGQGVPTEFVGNLATTTNQVVLEDVAICMSKCASNVANGTGVKSGVSWMPDGVSLIHLIHQEWSLMVTLFNKLLFCCKVFCQWPVL